MFVSLNLVTTNGRQIRAVVFDLLYTLVQPSTYAGGTGRIGWLANIMGVQAGELGAHWAAFEQMLESGQAPEDADGSGPELAWVRSAAAEFGVTLAASQLAEIGRDWDLTRREALLNPPESSVCALVALRDRGFRVGVLSNTHARELRAWDQSPLASLVDVVALSHEIGACKPDAAAYAYVLNRLGVPAAAAAYVGDGSSDELAGARAAGFGMVMLADSAPARLTPDDIPRLKAQADVSVSSLTDVLRILAP